MIPIIEIERKLLLRYAIVMNQAGNVGGNLAFYLRGIDGDLDKFDITRIKINISDLYYQVYQLCLDLKLNPDEVFNMGKERYLERKREFITKKQRGFIYMKWKKIILESITGFILWSMFLSPYMIFIVKVTPNQYLAWLSMQIILVTPVAPIVFRITRYVNKKVFGDS